MDEDDIYRSSTQFKFWSFTEEDLTSLRATTNSLAAARVRDAIARLRSENESKGQTTNDATVDCLAVDEEQKLVGFYCIQAMDFADFCGFPTNVKATAVQYLKRFYLSNSPMTYHPKQMMPSALFLSTKTENFHTKLKDFAEKLPNTTAEAIIAPEFLLTQGLRFTFDVRHPHRGLEGIAMELNALLRGEYEPMAASKKPVDSLREEMLQLEQVSGEKQPKKTVSDLQSRVERAHARASQMLKTSAILSDAYFLYTPSQIAVSSLMVTDRPLTLFYLRMIMGDAASAAANGEVLKTLESCTKLLSSTSNEKPSELEMKELKRIDKKLYKCRNPEKMDLVSISNAQKRDGELKSNGTLDEKIIKKRKLEREASKKEAEDLFGPSLA